MHLSLMPMHFLPSVLASHGIENLPCLSSETLCSCLLVQNSNIDYMREWLETPSPLVALMGREDIHSAITQNMPNTHALQLVSVQSGYVMPRKKMKRINYEGYEPEGVMKTGWAHKHRRLLPGVVALLVEWEESKDWDTQVRASLLLEFPQFRLQLQRTGAECVRGGVQAAHGQHAARAAHSDRHRSPPRCSFRFVLQVDFAFCGVCVLLPRCCICCVLVIHSYRSALRTRTSR